MKVKVTEIQRFCMHDGPGVRTVVFLKGCPLRCFWCHNPETASCFTYPLYYEKKCLICGTCASVCPQNAHLFTDKHSFNTSLCISCGRCTEVCPSGALKPNFLTMETSDIINEVVKDLAFYGDEGGLTLSGGDPLVQSKECAEILRIAKEKGIKTCIETEGYTSENNLRDVLPYTDLFLWDYKESNPERFLKNCGQKDPNFGLNLLHIADEYGTPSILRCILLEGINTEISHYQSIVNAFHSLKHCRRVELLPYHAYSGSKMLPLGLSDNGDETLIPTAITLQQAKSYLEENNVPCFIR